LKVMNDVAASINMYVDFIYVLRLMCLRYKIFPLKASPFFNFRDALFHYILYCKAESNDEKVAQKTSIEEHLFRGAKDMLVVLLYGMKQRILCAFQGAASQGQRRDLRKLLHEYKELELSIRTKAELAFSRDFGKLFIRELTELLMETQALFCRHGIDFPEDKD